MEERIHIIVGHYGSGKTEFAVNYALNLKKSFKKVYIVDLDIVNPYFRTNDIKDQLESLGLLVIAPPYASSNVDVPVLPAEVQSVFNDKDAAVVFDVGGDDDGAVALGRYKRFFDKEKPVMLFVINPYRPMTASKEQIKDMIISVETVSRLKVTGLVNNGNLGDLSEVSQLIKGDLITKEVEKEMNIPYVYATGLEAFRPELSDEIQKKFFPVKRFLALTF